MKTPAAPLKNLKDGFGDKAKVAAQLAATMDLPDRMTREQFQKQLASLPNAKLLKLKEAEDAFIARFGGKREKAVAVILQRLGLTGDKAESFKEQAETFSRAKLLDMAGPAPK